MTKFLIPLLFSAAMLGLPACAQQKPQEKAEANQPLPDSLYTYRQATSPDGTGKFYMGRNIAQVMGHLGAEWLERPDRQSEERTDLLLRTLDLKKDDVVADIGAGTGYFTFRISPLVPQGEVLAVDIQPEMLTMIRNKTDSEKVSNVQTILGTEQSPQLPADSVDLVLMVDAYHEFTYPREMMENIAQSLKPGGRVVLAEYRAEDPGVMIKPKHKMTETQAVKEMQAVGLRLIENKKVLPQQHLMFFGLEE